MEKYTIQAGQSTYKIAAASYSDAVEKAYKKWPHEKIKVIDVEGESPYMAPAKIDGIRKGKYEPDRLKVNLRNYRTY